MKQFHVYIMTNAPRGTLYVGVTSALERRVAQHKSKQSSGFTRRYNLTMLVYAEPADDAMSAIAREKQIKGLSRARKIALIEGENPAWEDLARDWLATHSTDQTNHSPRERDSSLRSE
jgi:putative endonuclease